MAGGKRQIKHLVENILRRDIKARNSDRYLYVEVVKELTPELTTLPFTEAILNAKIPCMETVRRSRQWCQEHFPELGASDNVEAARELEEEDYKETFCYGGC